MHFFTSSFIEDNVNCQYVISNITGTDYDSVSFEDRIIEFGLGTAVIGLIVFIMSYIFVTSLNRAAECQVWIPTAKH